VEDHAPNSHQPNAGDGRMQSRFGGNAEHHQMAWRCRLPGKLPPGLQAGMANLNDLIREGNIGPNQDVGIGLMLFKHWPAPAT
jgi:hypothetical protein